MKKIYIFVLSAVTVFCVILGTLVHVGGWLDLGFFPFGGDSGSSTAGIPFSGYRCGCNERHDSER